MSLAETLLNNGPLMAVVGSLVTVAGTGAFAYFGQGKTIKVDESTSIRVELRQEIDKLRLALNQKDLDLTEWRDKYYALMAKYNEAVRRERQALGDLEEYKKDLEEAKRMMEERKSQRTIDNGPL